MSTVTKRELVLRICEEVDLTQVEVGKVVQLMIDNIAESLGEGDEVVLRNFGTFQTMVTKPKKGRNPKKPEVEVAIPSRRVVKFRPGKVLKRKVDL